MTEPEESPPDPSDRDANGGERQFWHDWTGPASLSTTVVLAAAEVTGRAPADLPPLNDSIDPDALDSIFSPGLDTTLRTEGYVAFEFVDYDVRVHANGNVVFSPLEEC